MNLFDTGQAVRHLGGCYFFFFFFFFFLVGGGVFFFFFFFFFCVCVCFFFVCFLSHPCRCKEFKCLQRNWSNMIEFPKFGLAYLLDHFCGVKANKEYQKSDWRIR